MTVSRSSSRRARALAAYGRALQAIGLWRQAGFAFEAALARDNRVPDWRYRLGLSLEHQGQLTEAATEYEQVLARGDADLRHRAQSAIERMTRKALDGRSRDTPLSRKSRLRFCRRRAGPRISHPRESAAPIWRQRLIRVMGLR